MFAPSPVVKYYTRKCISCLNKVVIKIELPSKATEALCPQCQAIVRIWP